MSLFEEGVHSEILGIRISEEEPSVRCCHEFTFSVDLLKEIPGEAVCLCRAVVLKVWSSDQQQHRELVRCTGAWAPPKPTHRDWDWDPAIRFPNPAGDSDSGSSLAPTALGKNVRMLWGCRSKSGQSTH